MMATAVIVQLSQSLEDPKMKIASKVTVTSLDTPAPAAIVKQSANATAAPTNLDDMSFFMPSAEDANARLTQIMSEHWAAASVAADKAMSTINSRLTKIELVVKSQHPEASGKWDFTLKDGHLSVVAERLTAATKKDIEKQINGDKVLVAAAQSLANAAVTRFETSQDNPSASTLNAYTGKVENYTYYKVADQLNGKINFRDLTAKTKAYLHFDNKNSAASNLESMGSGSMDVIASQLRSSSEGVTMYGMKFTAK